MCQLYSQVPRWARGLSGPMLGQSGVNGGWGGGKGVAQQLANISDELGASLEQWSTFFLWEARSSQVCARPFVAQKIA